MSRQYLPYNQKSTYYIPTSQKEPTNYSTKDYLSPQPTHSSPSDSYLPANLIRPSYSHDDNHEDQSHQIQNPSHLINYQPIQMTKDTQHKRLPIIYGSFNEHPNKPPIKIQTKVLNSNQINHYSYQDEGLNQNHQVHVDNGYNSNYKESSNRVENNQNVVFETFQNLPDFYQQSTAKFINYSDRNGEDKYQFRNGDGKPNFTSSSSINHQDFQVNNNNLKAFSHNLSNNYAKQERIMNPPPQQRPIFTSPQRVVISPPPQRVFSDSYDFPLGVNSTHHKPLQPKYKPINQIIPSSQFIQISKQQYEALLFYRSQSQKNSHQKAQLHQKCEQLTKSKLFYHEQNNSLRHEIERLHNQVSISQNKSRQLLRENKYLKDNLVNDIIPKYRQSVLEQVGLLMERYRLEQKRKT